MSNEAARVRAKDFLKIADQFKLGALITESSHPVTANLSEVAKNDISAALGLLFDVDRDVIAKYREWVQSGTAGSIKQTILDSINSGGKIFFTGCGATGRLSIQLNAIWRDFWQKQPIKDLENRAFSVMAGGDFALIKSVEGFEDFADFGAKQIEDLGVSAGDVVFAITEGGETSFVIGTAWKALEKDAKVYFVYNNPDSVLREHVERSREVIDEPRIEKINLTTGPMAITGSTRMQATTIQLCVMLTLLEMVLRDLTNRVDSASVPMEFLGKLEEMHKTLQSESTREQLTALVSLEESVYKSGNKNNYFADKLAIDVLTDTTERSPTFCTPSFRKIGDAKAAESWSFLFLPFEDTATAWDQLLKRKPIPVEWTKSEVQKLVSNDRADKFYEIMQRISFDEILKFKIGLDGLKYRLTGPGDSATAIITEEEKAFLLQKDGFYRRQLESAKSSGASIGLIYLGGQQLIDGLKAFLASWDVDCKAVFVPVPENDFLLNGITRVGVKMLLNALSTCTMVRLGRVMGNYMIWVVASNLKLIDRATRYIEKLTGLSYEEACYLLFEVIEYVSPRMLADQKYPPVVGLSVMRAKYGLTNEEAEEKLSSEFNIYNV